MRTHKKKYRCLGYDERGKDCKNIIEAYSPKRLCDKCQERARTKARHHSPLEDPYSVRHSGAAKYVEHPIGNNWY